MVRSILADDIGEILSYDLTGSLRSGPAQVHAYRIAVRRLRADLHTFVPLLDPGWVDALRAESLPVGVALAAIRHIDVFLEYLGRAVEDGAHPDPGAVGLAAQLLDRRAEAHARLLDVLEAPQYRGLVDELARATTDLWVDPHPMADSRQPARDVFPSLLHRPYRLLKGDARALERSSRASALDDLRVRARHIRYAAEAMVPVLGEPAHRLADASAALHAVLGTLNEVALCLRWLDEPPAGVRVDFSVQRRLSATLREVAAEADRAWPHALQAVLAARSATLTPATSRSVVGAGGVVWRNGSRLIEVVLVHRRQHNDWSLPKGIAELGESPVACALREVEEETGLRCRVGPELPSATYRNQDGRRKLIRYWAMAPTSGTLGPQAEVDDARWLTMSQALRKATRARDVVVLRALQDSLRGGGLLPEGAG